MEKEQQAKELIRVPDGGILNPDKVFISFAPYSRMLREHRTLMDELSFGVAEFIWADTGLTEPLYSALIEDIKVVMLHNPDTEKKSSHSCPWQRKVQLALIQLRLGTDRIATGRVYQYRSRVPTYDIGLEWIDKALFKIFPLEDLTKDDIFELEAIMFKRTGLTGYIMAIDCKVVAGNSIIKEDGIVIRREQLVFSCIAGDGHPLYAESMWRTETDESAFRKSKLWSIINGMDLFAFVRMVDGVRICSPGIATVDHQMDFNSWIGAESKNIISGSIATSDKCLTAAQKFVNIAIDKGQDSVEHCFGTTCTTWGSLAQLPVVRGNTKHSHDLLLTVLPLKMRAYLHATEHKRNKLLQQHQLADAGTCESEEKETYGKVAEAHSRLATKLPSLQYAMKQARPATRALCRYEGPAPEMTPKEKARMNFFTSLLPRFDKMSDDEELEMQRKILGLFKSSK